MRVLMVMSSLLPGGAERVTLDLAAHLVSRGHEVHLMVARQSTRTPSVYSVPHGTICHRAKWGTEGRLTRAIVNLLLLKRLLRRLSPDWIVSLGAQYKLISISGALDSYRVLLSERNYPPERYADEELAFVREVYSRATRVVFQTEDASRCFPNLPREKVHIIPNAIRFESVKWCGIESKKISFVGRLIEQKNPGMLLGAFSLFRVKHPDYRLHIYGDGPMGEQMRSLCRELMIDKFVVFHGHVTDVDMELSSSRMYVSTSNFEGISNSMLEALAMGVPTICTDCAGGGARLAIDNGINGILIPCGDTQALAEAMSRVADDDELAGRFSTNAVELAQRFSEDRIFPLWERALE